MSQRNVVSQLLETNLSNEAGHNGDVGLDRNILLPPILHKIAQLAWPAGLSPTSHRTLDEAALALVIGRQSNIRGCMDVKDCFSDEGSLQTLE